MAESEIIVNPSRDNTSLIKTDGTTISLDNEEPVITLDNQEPIITLDNKKQANLFDGISLDNTNVNSINEEKEASKGNLFNGKSLGSDDQKLVNYQNRETNHIKVKEEAKGYFSKKTGDLKHWAVGDKAEWGKYWEIALGHSVTNVMMEYHFDKQMWGAVDWETAFGPELEDTGFVEKLFLQGASIVADAIPLLIGSKLTGWIPMHGSGAYGAGFFTESLRTTYHKALQKGDVDTFSEWWDIFIDEGIAEGHKAGLTYGVAFGLPKALGLDLMLKAGILTRAQHYVANVLTQWTALQAMGYYHNGEFADGEQMALDGILIGGLGIGQSGKLAINERSIKKNQSASKVINEAEKKQKDAEILYSKNQNSFDRTNTGEIKSKPMKYISVELVREDIAKIIPNLKEKVEWQTKGEKANEKARFDKYEKLDKELIELDKEFENGLISELEARQRYAEIGDAYSKLLKDKNLALTIELETRVDVSKSSKYQAAQERTNKKLVNQIVEIEPPLSTKVKTWIKEHTTQWWDQAHPVKKAQIEVVKNGKHQGVLDPYEMARLLTAKNQMGESFLHEGVPLSITGTARGKSWNKILLDNFDIYAEVVDARNYLYSRRIMELYDRGTKDLYKITKEEYQDAQTIVNGTSLKAIKGANEIRTFEKQVLDWSYQNKYISKEMYKVLLETGKDYIPLARETVGGEKASNPMFKLKGSEKNVIDPIFVIPLNTVNLARRVYTNNMLREFFEPILRDPSLLKSRGMEIVTKKTKITTLERKEIARVLGLTKDKISGFKLDELYYQFFKQEYNFREENAIFFKDKKGETIGVKVPEELYFALKNQNPGMANNVFNSIIFSGPTTVAKNTITLSLPFFVRNIIRDTKVAAIVSKNNNYIPVYQMIRGIFLTYGKEPFTFKKDPQRLLEQYIAGGGFDSHFFKMKRYSDPKIREILDSRDFYGQLTDKQGQLSKVQSFLIRAAETSEIAAKLADFELTIKNLKKERSQGQNNMTDQQIFERALFDAKNLMDFSKAGLKAEMWNQGSMFFNARLRGLDKIQETWSERPLATFAKSVTWTSIPYLTVYLLNNINEKAREAYDALSDVRKDTGYNIPMGDGQFMYIAGEWEWFQFFGAQLGAWLDYAKKRDPDILAKFYKQAALNFVTTNVNSLLPDIGRMAILEQAANWDLFYDRPVVTKRHAGRLPQYEYTPQTSYLGKKIGAAISYSPIKIDRAILSLFNSYGKVGLSAIDYAAEKFGYEEAVVSPFDVSWIGELDRMPFFKAFVVRNDDLTSAHLSRLWDTFNTVSEYARSYEFLIEGNEAQRKEAEKLEQDPKFQLYEFALVATEGMSSIYNSVRIIANQPNSEFSAKRKNETTTKYERRILAEKDAIIDPMLKTMIEAAKVYNKIMDGIKKD